MTLAEGSASDVTTSETLLTSANVRSFPPVMLYTIPVALSIDRSIKGADVAAMAASSARFFPLETPTPSMAVPELHMMVFTSAKSTLTNPGMVMMSEIPCTPCLKTSSASKKASWRGVDSPTTSNRRSFGITINVSTFFLSVSTPSVAWLARRLPSNVNGNVTTPTVKIPISFDRRATTGAAPVPVPPPIPAVINTISAPFIAEASS
mmetsp:Transcript_1984/g.4085  ORF Transcript_1984/g.4085 Transcript_1984/m.4085 type:complete len:207 (+) Transcript_1984:1385-2005(+)